jgi:hypothetical protein
VAAAARGAARDDGARLPMRARPDGARVLLRRVGGTRRHGTARQEERTRRVGSCGMRCARLASDVPS